MYLWELVGHDAAGGSSCSGVGGDLGPIMWAVEAELAKFPGLDGRVTEVVPRMSVSHLGMVYVPTGREWLARRDERGAAYWEARRCPASPDAVYGATPGDIPAVS